MKEYLSLPTLKPGTIASYWAENGCTAAEAQQLEKEQIQRLIEQEELLDALENIGWGYCDNT